MPKRPFLRSSPDPMATEISEPIFAGELSIEQPSCRCAPFVGVDYGEMELRVAALIEVKTEKEVPNEIVGKPRLVEGELQDKCPVCKEYLEAGYLHGSCADQVGYNESSVKALPAPISNEQVWE